MVQLSHPYMTNGKTTALTRRTFIHKVMSLLFNILSRFVVAFLSRSKHLLLLWLQSLCSNFGVQEDEIWHCFHFLNPSSLSHTHNKAVIYEGGSSGKIFKRVDIIKKWLWIEKKRKVNDSRGRWLAEEASSLISQEVGAQSRSSDLGIRH